MINEMEELNILSNVKKRVIVNKSLAEILRAYKYYKCIDIYEGQLIIFSNAVGIEGPNGLANITEDIISEFCGLYNQNHQEEYTQVSEININKVKNLNEHEKF